MSEHETRLLRSLRRQWLIEQMGAITAEMDALVQPDGPRPYHEDMEPAAYLAIMQAYHDAAERYCVAWDALQARYMWHAEEMLENVRCGPDLNAVEMAFIAVYDQWKQYVTDFQAEDVRLAERIRERARRAGGRA